MEEKQIKERSQRFAVILSATLVNEREQKIAVRIRNFSETGLGVNTDQPLRLGEIVLIELRSLRLRGQVVRQSGNLFGVRVDSQINIAEMTQRPATKTAFEVSDIHKIADKTYRPRLTARKSAR